MEPEFKIYNLRIVPPEPIFGEVSDFKTTFIDRYGKQPLSKSKPHITLAVFKMDIQYQDFLVKAFDQLATIPKFKLDIEGFGLFENAKVLLLKISNSKSISEIHEKTRVLWIRELHRKPSTLKLPTTPHITISKTQGNKMLYESLAFFQSLGYSKTFEVEKLTLVSRYPGKTWTWEHHITLS